jgi:hypothetical protein
MAARKPADEAPSSPARPSCPRASTPAPAGRSARPHRPTPTAPSAATACGERGPVVHEHPGGYARQIVAKGGLVTEGVKRELEAADKSDRGRAGLTHGVLLRGAGETRGATGTDAEVAAWIEAARERITGTPQQLFEPTDLVVVADVARGDWSSSRAASARSPRSRLSGGRRRPVDPVVGVPGHLVCRARTDRRRAPRVGRLQRPRGGRRVVQRRLARLCGSGGVPAQVKVAGSFGYDAPPLLVALGVRAARRRHAGEGRPVGRGRRARSPR